MRVWNREELYEEVWEQPLVKVAAKYGISAVMVGKICRKLQIPLPGRGYWTKKQFGKPVTRVSLPAAKNLPIVQRMKETTGGSAVTPQNSVAEPEPTDPEWMRIIDLESRSIQPVAEAKQHRLVAITARNLKHARADRRGILEPRHDEPSLDVRVSKGALDRGLDIVNAIIQALETEGFPVSLEDRKGARVQIFGQQIRFELVEKVRETSRREVEVTPTWTRTEIDYQPSGILEFRVGEFRYSSRRASATEKSIA